MRAPPNPPSPAGFLLAVLPLAGAGVGFALGQPTAGFLAGLAAGGAAAGAAWLRGRR